MTVHAYAAKSARGALEPFEYDPPPLGPGEIDIRVTHCGICHSDLAMIDNDWGFSAYPLVPGHEVIGVVSSVGANFNTLKPGLRVGLGWQCGSCQNCEWCSRGLESLCAKEADTIVGRFGGWADFVRAQARFVIPIPDALDSATAAPLLCAGTTVFTPMLRHPVTSTMRTAVVGIGGLGHLAVQFLAKFGCEVTAISSTHEKDGETRRLGANYFIATRGGDELAKAAGSFDFVISTVSANIDWTAIIASLRPQGRLVIVGVPESALPISAFSLIQGEKQISGGRTGSPQDIRKMFEFAARHGIGATVQPFPMSEINKAVDHLRSGKARYRVVLTA